MASDNFNSILEYLNEEPLRNYNIIGFAESNPVTLIRRSGSTVLAAGISDREWFYIKSDDEDELRRMLNELDRDVKCFGGIEDRMIPVISELGEVDWILSVYNYYFPSNVNLPPNKIEITNLVPDDAYFIIEQSHYKQFLTIEYIKQRIEKSFSAAIHENGKLAAWGLTHDDSSLGMLHVVDEYRNKGYGKEITISLINQCREKGKIPVAQIEQNKIASIKLCEKLGFIKDRSVSWMKLK